MWNEVEEQVRKEIYTKYQILRENSLKARENYERMYGAIPTPSRRRRRVR